jgi:hypothetical protein
MDLSKPGGGSRAGSFEMSARDFRALLRRAQGWAAMLFPRVGRLARL